MTTWLVFQLRSVEKNLFSHPCALATSTPIAEQRTLKDPTAGDASILKNTVVKAIIFVPCQIIEHARQSVHRLLNWTDYTAAFFRLCEVLNL